MTNKKSFLEFVEIENPKGKTKKFQINNKQGEMLGWIHWRSGWRKYVYGTIQAEYDTNCLTEITDFLNKLMNERKTDV